LLLSVKFQREKLAVGELIVAPRKLEDGMELAPSFGGVPG